MTEIIIEAFKKYFSEIMCAGLLFVSRGLLKKFTKDKNKKILSLSIVVFLCLICYVVLGIWREFYLWELDGTGFINFCSKASPIEIEEKIRSGANVNAVYSDETRSPILVQLAYWSHSNDSAFNVLIKAGSNVNATDNCGRTALMWASFHGDIGIMSALIRARANINAKNNEGETALMYAVKSIIAMNSFSYTADISYGLAEAIVYLINAGANINAVDNKGMTVLSYAEKIASNQQDFMLINYLRQAGARK